VNDGNVSVSLPEYVSTIDLSKPFNNSDTSIWQYISKNATSSNNSPPTLNDGSIFATDSSLYLFGGALSAAPGAPKLPPPNGIWQYGFRNGNWVPIVPGGNPVQRRALSTRIYYTYILTWYKGFIGVRLHKLSMAQSATTLEARSPRRAILPSMQFLGPCHTWCRA